MANKYTDILNITANGKNQMGLSNTIKRDYGIPLDFTSVQADFAKAVEYAATSTLAYVGQPISVGDKLYIITEASQGKYPAEVAEGESQLDVFLAEVGSATEGDGSTIDLKDGVLSLHGIDGKTSGTYVPTLVNGVLTWNVPDNSSLDDIDRRFDEVEADIKSIDELLNGTPANIEEDIPAKDGFIKTTSQALENLDANLEEAVLRIDDVEEALLGKLSNGDGYWKVDETSKTLYAEGPNSEYVRISHSNIGITNDIRTVTIKPDSITIDDTYNTNRGRSTLELTADSITTSRSDDSDNKISAVLTLPEKSGTLAVISDLDNKADKSTTLSGYGITDAYTQAQVNELISNITHFTAQVIVSLEEVTEPRTDVLYLLKDEKVLGSDKYNEYIYIEGLGFTLIGDTTTDLTNYVSNDALALELANYTTTEGLTPILAPYAKIADVYNKTETNKFLEVKVESATLKHTSEGVVEGVTKNGTTLNIVIDAYTKSETEKVIDDKIEKITGGESAAEVKADFEAHREIIDTEIWGADLVTSWKTEDGYTPDYTQNSRLDVLVEQVGKPSIENEAPTGLYLEIENVEISTQDAIDKLSKEVDDKKLDANGWKTSSGGDLISGDDQLVLSGTQVSLSDLPTGNEIKLSSNGLTIHKIDEQNDLISVDTKYTADKIISVHTEAVESGENATYELTLPKKSGTIAILTDIPDITGLTAKLVGIDGTVKAYVDDAIANIPTEIPVATNATIGGIKSAVSTLDEEENEIVSVNKLYVDAETGIGEIKALSTDNLVQGTSILILDGGTAAV